MNAKPIYHLSLIFRSCLARVTLNGFQLAAVDARAPLSIGPPLNAFLVGKGNTLSIQALPTLTREGMSKPTDIHVDGRVAAFQEGDIVAPEGGGDVVLDIDLIKGLAGAVPSVPLLLNYEFDTEGPAFPELFKESEIIEEPEPLVAYGAKLRDLFARADISGIEQEFAPKLRDYAIAYYETEAAMRAEFTGYIQGALLPGPMDLAFKDTEIVPVSMCEGRIWELKRKGTSPLLSTLPDKQGGRLEIPVYVAKVDGALKVVR